MNKNDEVKTKLVYETEDDRYIWESPYMDVDMQDILDAFFGMLVSATWQPTTIINAMQDFVYEHNDLLDSDEPGCIFNLDDGDDECGAPASEFEKDVDEEEVTWPKKRNITPAPHFYA